MYLWHTLPGTCQQWLNSFQSMSLQKQRMRLSHLEVASEVVKPKPESLQLGFRVHAWRKRAALPHLHPATLSDSCADTVLISLLYPVEKCINNS